MPNTGADKQRFAASLSFSQVNMPLSLERIKGWVDAYRAAHEGEFPTQKSGAIKDREGNDTGETWSAVNALFRVAAKGCAARGLQHCGFGSLADFLDKTYPNEREPRIEKAALSLSQIKEWVDVYRAEQGGRFPTMLSGAIKDREGKDTGETWAAVNSLFRSAAKGFPARGLENCGFGSLADFLDKTYPTEREPRIEKAALSPSQIKEWVDAYREGHGGRFPTTKCGAIKGRKGDDTGENWRAVDALFNCAAKGFPARGLQHCGFGSLAEFLDKTYPDEREPRIEKAALNVLQIKEWVDVYRAGHEREFPSMHSGAIKDREGKDTGENWRAVDALFRKAAKGFPARGLQHCGFGSLAEFLDKTYPTEREHKADLNLSQIKEWVDVYRAEQGGRFPTMLSGAIKDREGKDTGENWAAVNSLFWNAAKGFPARGLQHCGFGSLAKFLDKTYSNEREPRIEKTALSLSQIKEWVDAYREGHRGRFPTTKSGAIKDREGKDTGENWAAVDALFNIAANGFPARGLRNSGFGSLADFLDKTYLTEREHKADLSLSQIKEWVDAYREEHRGRFPTGLSGAIKDREGKDTGETWVAVDALFRSVANGFPARGLRNSGFGSLAEFLDKTYPHERRQHSAPNPAIPRGDNINPLLDLLE